MTTEDLQTFLGWAREEGWNPGSDDAAAFLAADPQGFFVGEVDNALVAAVSAVNHSDAFAFLGLYLCHPAFRGQGYGYALWQHALAHAEDRVVGLDGIPDQQDNYRKSGFALMDQTWRYEGEISGAPDPYIKPATQDDTGWVVDLDANATGYEKPEFLAAWLTQAPSRRTLVLPNRRGFATYRRCDVGYKVGPLVTSNVEDAAALLRHIAADVKDRLMIDVPESCTTLTDFCKAQGMAPSFNTARMYRGPAPLPGSTCYAVATLELG